jgi:hypothetical protein
MGHANALHWNESANEYFRYIAFIFRHPNIGSRVNWRFIRFHLSKLS